MSDLILFWHRKDLRISDNIGLAAAYKISPKVIGIFCLDPNILKQDDIAPARVNYMIGCLDKLQESYAEIGGELLIIHNEPSQGIPKLASALQAKAIYWNLDVEPYARERDRLLIDTLKNLGIQVETFWDQLLHNPSEIRTGNNQIYTVYTPFWNNWNNQVKSPPVETINNLKKLTETEKETAKIAGIIPLPTAKDLGYVWDKTLILEPGEKSAIEKLDNFCQKAIYEYDTQRNFPGIDGTSLLSPALKFGAIGIRTIWNATLTTWEKTNNTETQKNILTWQKELAWREFYQYVMYHFPELATGPYRPAWQNFPWHNNQTYFQAWCEGKTGYPIVDAAMRQLNATGWMHNRCRMIVASFLTKDLIINWQWGEKYFMQKLIDGDISANNGGWQWSASSGMDTKPLRIFNPAMQAEKFDGQAKYIRHWLPELAKLDTPSLLSGKILPLQCKSLNYPLPIVDHNQQQRLFKDLYNQQKEDISK